MEFEFNPLVAFIWSVFAGFLMAMGAGGGGVLAGIGHISVLGIGDPNVIKVVNQLLEVTSRLVSVPLYLKQKRIVWPLAISFGVGAPLGAISGSWLSKLYLADMSTYRFMFGILAFAVAVRTFYEAAVNPQRRSSRLQKAYTVSDRIQRGHARGSTPDSNVPHTVQMTILCISIRCGTESFEFNPLAAAAGGFAISFIGSMLGVGGGFLVTPFMASILLFPLFFVSGTALVALALPLLVSVATYLLLNVNVDWLLIFVEIPGIVVGSIIGPLVNRRINERYLRLFVAAVLFCIGVYYLV